MIIILNISSEKFSLNGIPYFKNFMPHVVGGKLKIVNVYDSKLELTALDLYSNYSVDGVTYPNLIALQNALLPVLYTRNSLNFDSELPYYNQITKQTGITSLGLNKTINAGWEWLINNVQYSNSGPLTINFPLASSGKQRLDRVVATNLNTFVRIPGVESISSPTADPRPDNTVDVTFVLVSDTEVFEPTPPVIGDNFVLKRESQDFIASYGSTTVIDKLELNDDRSSVSLIGSATNVKSIQLSGEFIRPGKPHFFKNRTGHDVTIEHNSGTGNIKYFFSDAQNLILKNNEVLEFSLNANDGSNLKFELIGSKLATQIISAPEKTTVHDNDRIGNADSEDSNKTKYWKFSTIKATIKSYTDGFYLTITTAQTVSGLKTFLNGTWGFRNVANSFTSLFVNANTAARTYIFQDRNGTIADDTDLAGKQVIDSQIEISANSNVLNAWHGQTILFTASCTITVPASLNNSLMFPFRSLTGVTVTWAITAPHVWETTPVSMSEKTVGHFMKRGSTNTIILDF
ncbi:hypothetical protein EV143_1186 [Flavobacterium chryseum]|uniref:hypothetical protein n=1 Tax=Flavobacterium sp. P3160 TaxID=2512113 RepID=UPI00105C559B|nr:hypothetical protein [Flavobacterium sp. P3160]TDO68822.1 hypothetical protein EV143_1186 [Flavobacterium sp. P3160]